jgi:hypothetical protein
MPFLDHGYDPGREFAVGEDVVLPEMQFVEYVADGLF